MKRVFAFALFSAGVATLFWMMWGHDLQYTNLLPGWQALAQKRILDRGLSCRVRSSVWVVRRVCSSSFSLFVACEESRSLHDTTI
jgi:hypothetical protein